MFDSLQNKPTVEKLTIACANKLENVYLISSKNITASDLLIKQADDLLEEIIHNKLKK